MSHINAYSGQRDPVNAPFNQSEPSTGNICVFSDDRRYRYLLGQKLTGASGKEAPNILWVCLNPSTADEQKDDATVRRCKEFSRRWGFSSFSLVNIFAFRATNPMELYQVGDPVGEQNDFWIKQCAKGADQIVVAWGNHGLLHQRGEAVDKLLSGMPLWCFTKNKNGTPAHPLYRSYRENLVLFK